MRCGGALRSHSCIRCSQDLGCSAFFAPFFYSELKSFLGVRKTTPLQIGGLGPALELDVLLPEPRYAYDVFLVPSTSGEHWMEKGCSLGARRLGDYDGSVMERGVSSPLSRNPLKLSQKLLNKTERGLNCVNLFRIGDDPRRKSENALLIDDVISTGGSIRACAGLLKRLGYNQVSVFCLTYRTKLKEVDHGYR